MTNFLTTVVGTVAYGIGYAVKTIQLGYKEGQRDRQIKAVKNVIATWLNRE